ncbi:ATP-binding domain-containing protein [Kineosporia rhizophila]|uniref:HelD family protein n=1 Tax=Kineosporia TaxID=49184 RepID=UPI001E3B1907|nr:MULTISPECIES: ATP-binding domain-containing protein [Kineosporia]MCE0540760.1 ATP-binding domain-containing protein [Kineosporia rhizophila]GLY19415.1 DNA helicase [Kineosporia sp. NBRC 101677]
MSVGSADQDEIALEQKYFDAAWDARELKRQSLGGAASASLGGKTSVAVAKEARALAERIGGPDDAVALGRFDRESGETYYVGKWLISDQDGEPLVINWKAPMAAPFYEASHDDPQGLVRKRTFATERNRILSFDDVVYADLAARVGELTALEHEGIDDAVLRELDAARSGEMRDIVQTIHALQYELVRAPLEQLLIVQGGPGTGKTVVGLHRVSWLLYNHSETLAPSDVLVVGPNPTFTRYIRQVLPGLGDHQVEHRDLRGLGLQKGTGRQESAEVVRIKGELRMQQLLMRGLVQRIRLPERAGRLDVGPAGDPVASFSRPEVEDALRRSVNQARSYGAGRAAMRSWISATAAVRARRGVEVPDPAVDAALQRVWPSLTPQMFLRDLFGSRDRLLAAAGQDFTAAEVQMLFRPASDRVSDEGWSLADVALLDETDLLLNGSVPQFGHIVLDEAQDLSPMQLRSVRRRSRTGSYTVLGDLAQSTGPWARDTWDDVVEALRVRHPESIVPLTLGYRVPQQVYALAAQLLPHAAPAVEPLSVIRLGPAEPDLRRVPVGELGAEAVRAACEYAARGLFVGIICADEHRAAVVEMLNQDDVQYQDTRAGSLGKSINLVGATDAKGLEFEAVVVVEPESIVSESTHGLRLLYVALTRTTKFLTVVHAGPVLPIPAEKPSETTQEIKVVSLQGQTVSKAQNGLDDFSAEFAVTLGARLAENVAATAQPRLWKAIVAAFGEELERRRPN